MDSAQELSENLHCTNPHENVTMFHSTVSVKADIRTISPDAWSSLDG